MLNANIPMPLQVVLDDVGWWSGEDGNFKNEPFRTGIARNHVPADYAAIASLGRQLNMAPAACFILGEWDTKNILRELPYTQWMGERWDNSRWNGPWIEEAAHIVRTGRDHLELALHGIMHEYWINGKTTRAQWHECATGTMRPYDQLHAILEAFATLLDQHNLGAFPTSFCPCAGGHRFGDGERGIDGLLAKFGVKYTGTPFFIMPQSRPTQHQRFGIDNGVLTIDRQYDILPWPSMDTTPPADIPGPIAGIHWPNILHPDPSRNEETVARWVTHLKAFDLKAERMLSRNTAECWTQYVHHLCVRVSPGERDIMFNFTELDALPPFASTGVFTVKLYAAAPATFTAHGVQIVASEHRSASNQQVLTLRRTSGTTARLTRTQ